MTAEFLTAIEVRTTAGGGKRRRQRKAQRTSLSLLYST